MYQLSKSKPDFSLYINIPHQTFSKSKVQENMLCIPEMLTARVQPFENKQIIHRLLTYFGFYALSLEIKKKTILGSFIEVQ